VLDGNSPRFPWKPSTTMLISRHAGTTDDSVSDRSAHGRFSPGPAHSCQRRSNPQPRADLPPPRRVPQGPRLLIYSNLPSRRCSKRCDVPPGLKHDAPAGELSDNLPEMHSASLCCLRPTRRRESANQVYRTARQAAPSAP
jgi:hypothetical protein